MALILEPVKSMQVTSMSTRVLKTTTHSCGVHLKATHGEMDY